MKIADIHISYNYEKNSVMNPIKFLKYSMEILSNVEYTGDFCKIYKIILSKFKRILLLP